MINKNKEEVYKKLIDAVANQIEKAPIKEALALLRALKGTINPPVNPPIKREVKKEKTVKKTIN